MKVQKLTFPLRFIIFLIVFAAYQNIFSQINWTKYEHNPIFETGAPGTWDCCAVGILSVLYDEGIYKAWYVGYDENSGRIGYATSADGLVWTKYEGNPVLVLGDPGTWDASEIDHACIIKVNGTYHMWYNGEDSTNYRIGYASSQDGINWDKYEGNPVIDLGDTGSWKESEVFHPSVVYDGATFHMWYNGYGQSMQRTGYATSTDGINWQENQGNPVLEMGEDGSWDDYQLLLMATIYKDNHYHMWYSAGDGSDEDKKYYRIGYATSLDGINWNRHPDNPVLDIGETATWDSLGVVTSTVLYDSSSNIYKMWYGGLDGSTFQTGYATAPQEPASGINGKLDLDVPTRYELKQNYPNPFNPRTVISWQLAVGSKVDLSVFNILGQKVTTLVAKYQPAGYHSVVWDAGGMASGIYYYTLQSGTQIVASKKMIIIQ